MDLTPTATAVRWMQHMALKCWANHHGILHGTIGCVRRVANVMRYAAAVHRNLRMIRSPGTTKPTGLASRASNTGKEGYELVMAGNEDKTQ